MEAVFRRFNERDQSRGTKGPIHDLHPECNHVFFKPGVKESITVLSFVRLAVLESAMKYIDCCGQPWSLTMGNTCWEKEHEEEEDQTRQAFVL